MTSTLAYLENAWGAQPLDIDSLILWLSGYGVVQGVNNECDVIVNTGTYGASDTITVQAGDVLVNGTRHSVPSTNLSVGSPSSSDRKDIVYIDDTGTPQVEPGDPATSGTEPSGNTGRDTWRPHPDDFSGITGTPLKEIYVASTSGSVASGDLSERRWYTTLQVEEADIRNLTAALDAQNNQIQNASLAGANLSLAAALDASSNDINNVGTLGAATVNPTNLGATTLTGNLDASSNQVQNAVLSGASLANALDASTQNINNIGTLGGPALSNATLTNAFDASGQDVQNVSALDTDTLDVQNETSVTATLSADEGITTTYTKMENFTASPDTRNEFDNTNSNFSPDNTGRYDVDILIYQDNAAADLNVKLVNATDTTDVAERINFQSDGSDVQTLLSGTYTLDSSKTYEVEVLGGSSSANISSTASQTYWTIEAAFT